MSLVEPQTLAWMGALVALFWALPRSLRLALLPLSTAALLATLAPLSLLALAGLTAVTWAAARAGGVRRESAPLIAIAGAVALFIAYRLTSLAAEGPLTTASALGLAYFTLRAIHYLIEAYKNDLPDHGLFHFVVYMFFTPTILAGPIHRFPDFQRELRRHRWDSTLFAEGLERVLFGYTKIVVLANYLASEELPKLVSDLGTGRPRVLAYLECVQYGVNLYFQFSGYSDIAIGLARLLGIRVMENFSWPFLCRNINEFWQSWHISLSSWCRDYVYMPITARTRRAAFGVVASMIALGLWHELSLRYLIWGTYHGLGIVVWRSYRRMRERLGLSSAETRAGALAAHALGTLINLNFVILSFAITKESSPVDAWHVYRSLLFGGP